MSWIFYYRHTHEQTTGIEKCTKNQIPQNFLNKSSLQRENKTQLRKVFAKKAELETKGIVGQKGLFGPTGESPEIYSEFSV